MFYYWISCATLPLYDARDNLFFNCALRHFRIQKYGSYWNRCGNLKFLFNYYLAILNVLLISYYFSLLSPLSPTCSFFTIRNSFGWKWSLSRFLFVISFCFCFVNVEFLLLNLLFYFMKAEPFDITNHTRLEPLDLSVGRRFDTWVVAKNTIKCLGNVTDLLLIDIGLNTAKINCLIQMKNL